MKAKFTLLLCVACTLSACSKPTEEETNLALAREIVKIAGLDSVPPIVVQSRTARFERALLQELSPEQQQDERIKKVVADITTELPATLKAETVFAEVLTLEELKAVIAFAETPLGRSTAEKERQRAAQLAARKDTTEEIPPINYTEEESEAMKAWKESPIGRSIQEKMPKMILEKEQALAKQVLENMKAKLHERIKDLK